MITALVLVPNSTVPAKKIARQKKTPHISTAQTTNVQRFVKYFFQFNYLPIYMFYLFEKDKRVFYIFLVQVIYDVSTFFHF
jgi:hypothetical protein